VAGRVKPLFRGGVDVLICGHIHVPQRQSLEVAGRSRDLFVLGDWADGSREIVVHDGRGFRLVAWKGGR
jgi:UDP-2,3-diacylglucosamine pyrophosphatase LpxH